MINLNLNWKKMYIGVALFSLLFIPMLQFAGNANASQPPSSTSSPPALAPCPTNFIDELSTATGYGSGPFQAAYDEADSECLTDYSANAVPEQNDELANNATICTKVSGCYLTYEQLPDYCSTDCEPPDAQGNTNCSASGFVNNTSYKCSRTVEKESPVKKP